MRMRLLQIGIGSAILDLGANRPESGDIYTLMGCGLDMMSCREVCCNLL